MKLNRSMVFLLALISSASCSGTKNMCSQGVELQVHDLQLYEKLVRVLKEQKVEFVSKDDRKLCYANGNHRLVTDALFRLKSETHPIGRIEIARGMDDEIVSSLSQENIRFSWFIEGDKLVLIVNPEDYSRADEVLDELLEKRWSGK